MSEINYGKDLKKICFEELDKRHADLKIRLHADGIKQGEFFSLLGASGCGKTTLLRLLAGFEKPDKGKIYIEGEDITYLIPNKRPTNMVFQNYAIFPHMDVASNIGYGLRKEKLSNKELHHRIDHYLELIKLSGYGNRKADQLSGGQRQRVALARALIMQPKVLLLDEPFAGVDLLSIQDIKKLLLKLQSRGCAVLVTDHNASQLLSVVDRAYVLASGNICAEGSPRQISNSAEAKRLYFGEDFRI